MKIMLALLIVLAATFHAWAQDLKPFEFEPENKTPIDDTQSPTCSFPELKLPPEFVVLAVGASSGRKIAIQIDQSGHEATQIDVAVNSPNKPIVLMLGAYDPTIWNIGWSQETKVLAVLASGYHRQVVAGLEKRTPTLISTHDNRGSCGYFYVTPYNVAWLHPLAQRVFGRPVDMVYSATNGKVVVGRRYQSESRWLLRPTLRQSPFSISQLHLPVPPDWKMLFARGCEGRPLQMISMRGSTQLFKTRRNAIYLL